MTANRGKQKAQSRFIIRFRRKSRSTARISRYPRAEVKRGENGCRVVFKTGILVRSKPEFFEEQALSE